MRDAFAKQLAAKLGITAAKVRSALDALHKAGPPGAARPERPRHQARRQRGEAARRAQSLRPGPGPRPGGPGKPGFDRRGARDEKLGALAKDLGVSQAKLKTALKGIRDDLKAQRDKAIDGFAADLAKELGVPSRRSTLSSTPSAIMGGVVRSDPLVLVVDDEATVRQALERALRLEGFAVATAADGWRRSPRSRSSPPAVIVLDVTMPGLDGVSVVQRLRSDGIDTPVCMLSARDEVEDRVAGLQAGADDYLVKPFAIVELTARLEALLRRHGSRGRGPAHGRATSSSTRAATSPPAPAASSASPAASSTCSTSSSATPARCSRATSCSRSSGATRPTSRPTSSTSSSATCAASSRSRGEPRILHTVRGVGWALRP